MSEAPSTGEWAGIIVALGGVIAIFGKGFSYIGGLVERRVTAKAQSREAKLQAWHTELEKREGALDEKLEGRLATLEAQAVTHAEQSMALRMAFELVASALRAIDPKNTALSRAEQLLVRSFPLAPIVPPDMSASLMTIETRDQAATAAGRRTEVAA